MDLVAHPDFPVPAVRRLWVEVRRTRPTTRLSIRFHLSADMRGLAMPPPAAAERTDGLWRQTCFEAFLAGPGSAYREFNLSPSGQWAAYDFDAYRTGIRPAEVGAPSIVVLPGQEETTLSAELDIPADAQRMGFSAVIETARGAKGYFALAHPPGRPDFHNRDCLVAEVPAVDAA
jgi:hypothetical protein